MSETKPTKGRPRRRSRWPMFKRLILVLALIGLIVAAVGLTARSIFLFVAERRLKAIMAQLDSTDPGWRWEEILANREVIPEDQNSARHVLAAAEAIPKRWPNRPAVQPKKPVGEDELAPPEIWLDNEQTLPARLEKVEAVERLDDELAAELRAELKELSAAVTEARKLANANKGRYVIHWMPDLMSTLLPHLEQVRTTASLLQLDAAILAQDGNIAGAFSSSQGILNAGRSTGDEPTVISILMRLACERKAISSVERVLAQGEVAAEALSAAQKLFEDEAGQPFMLRGYRAERAAWSQMMANIYAGLVPFEQLSGGRPRPQGWFSQLSEWAYIRPLARYNQAIFLEMMTHSVVEMLKQPRAQQMEAFDLLVSDLQEKKASSPHLALVILFLPSIHKISDAYYRAHAEVLCTQGHRT